MGGGAGRCRISSRLGFIERRSWSSASGRCRIIAAIGSEEFIRLRIGIQPEHPVEDTARFVLEKFPVAQRAEVEKILERSAEALRAVIRDGIDKAMAQYNG